ncbi:MAG: Putative oxidoreductase, partial [uncultured Nocardioides sp.]
AAATDRRPGRDRGDRSREAGDRPRGPQDPAEPAVRPPGRADGQARGVLDVQAAQEAASGRDPLRPHPARPSDHRAHGHGLAAAHRRRDGRHRPGVDGRRRVRGRADHGARLLHLQAGLHPRRRVLPLAVPHLRRHVARETRPEHRPDRASRAADRWAGEDRHVHRAPAPARRRPHHHHDALPAGRRTTLHGAARLRRLDPPAQGRRHRPARPDAGDLAGRRRRRCGTAGHPHQQRVPDRTAHARRLRPARRGGVGPAAHRHRAARARDLRPDLRGAPRGHRRRAVRHRRRAPRGRVARARARRPRRGDHDRTGAQGRPRVPRGPRRRHRGRRGWPAARRAGQQLVDADGRRGRPAGAPRGAALQLDRAVPAGLPTPPGAGRRRRHRTVGAVVRRQRLGDGGSVLPPLQGRRPPAHQHGEGRAQHAHPHVIGGDVLHRPDPDDRGRHRLDHRRAAAPREAADRGGGLARAARPRRRRRARLRPHRARRVGHRPLRLLRQGLPALSLV